jgi:hypothetical protein
MEIVAWMEEKVCKWMNNWFNFFCKVNEILDNGWKVDVVQWMKVKMNDEKLEEWNDRFIHSKKLWIFKFLIHSPCGNIVAKIF